MTADTLAIPRNTTHQADGLLYGRLSRLTNRATAMVIIVFVAVHVVVQAILHVPAFAAWRDLMPGLVELTRQDWIHAILMFSIVYHTLHGLRLVAGDLGANLPYRQSWRACVGIAGLFAAREVLRYAGL